MPVFLSVCGLIFRPGCPNLFSLSVTAYPFDMDFFEELKYHRNLNILSITSSPINFAEIEVQKSHKHHTFPHSSIIASIAPPRSSPIKKILTFFSNPSTHARVPASVPSCSSTPTFKSTVFPTLTSIGLINSVSINCLICSLVGTRRDVAVLCPALEYVRLEGCTNHAHLKMELPSLQKAGTLFYLI